MKEFFEGLCYIATEGCPPPTFYLLDVGRIYKAGPGGSWPGGDFQNIPPFASLEVSGDHAVATLLSKPKARRLAHTSLEIWTWAGRKSKLTVGIGFAQIA